MCPSDRSIRCASAARQECDYSEMHYFLSQERVYPLCKQHKLGDNLPSWLKKITTEEAYAYFIQSA